MKPVGWLLRRLRAQVATRAMDIDLEEEIRSHLDEATDEYIEKGLSPREARVAALRSFGGVTQTTELHREARSFPWFEDLRGDLRYAVRGLARNPGYAVTAVLTLALGIGANTAIFSVINAVLLKPLPYRGADRLVRLVMNVPAEDSQPPRRVPVAFTADELDQLRSRSRTLSRVATGRPEIVSLIGFEEAARLQGARVSGAEFEMIGARPLIGRLFEASDEAPDAEPVIVLSFDAWRRYFDGSPDVLGRSLALETVLTLGPRRQARYTVIGVMPESFSFAAANTQFWMTFQGPPRGRGSWVARLADGISLEAATAEVGPIAREIRRAQRGNADDNRTFELVREQDGMVAPVRPALLVLFGAVGFVLLIACVNVANLILARTAARQREMAVRVALGAGAGRITRQLVTESVVLAVTGGVAGVVLAVGGIGLFRTLATDLGRFDLGIGQQDFPRLAEIGMDLPAFVFALGVSLLTGILVGAGPAVFQARSAVSSALRDRVGISGSGDRIRRSVALRSALVVAEISLALVLVIGSGLLLHSFIKLSRVDVGYAAENVLTFQTALPLDRYPDDARLAAFSEDLMARLRSVPGVQSAAYARQLPLVQLIDSFQLRSTPDPPPMAPGTAPLDTPLGGEVRLVSADYLNTMGIRVAAGRGLGEQDAAGAPRAMVINQALARRAWPDENAVGKVVYLRNDTMPWEIVGVVNNVRQFGLDQESNPQFFVDVRQWPAADFPLFPVGVYYAVRTTSEPTSLVGGIRQAVRGADAEATLFNVASMEQLVANSLSRPRMYTVLLGLFAAIGVTLALIGVYGVMAYTVTRRTSEIGVRMALGAERGAVLGLVLRQSLVLTLAGIAVGLVAAAALTRYLSGLLFGLTPLDLTTYVSASLLFASVALLASYLPARRATRVDPLIALRCD